MKQTAVEWLMNELGFNDINETNYNSLNRLFNQAKEMEKEQIMDAYKHNSMIRTISKAEQYYNEIFKSE